MKRKVLAAFSIMTACIMYLGGCNNIPVAGQSSKVSLATQEEILSYIAGDWTLFDRKTGEDFGILSVDKEGSFGFTRNSDKAKGGGTLSFEKKQPGDAGDADSFIMKFDDCRALIPKDLELYGDEGTSGTFYVGAFGEEDYLYLKEIGNGDSVVSAYIFNTNEGSEEIGDWSYDWVFYRDKVIDNTAEVKKDETFYAWAWETDEDGVWLQSMTPHEFETFEDYSNRKFIGGYFTHTEDIGVVHYGVNADTDLSDLVNTSDYNSGYPLMMCEVSVDGAGNIKTLRDVDIAMYDVYDMGVAEPDFSYNGTTFIIEGVEIDVTEYAPGATAIMDAKRVADWIIVECHNNPNIGTYLFYNINDGLVDCFEYGINGANLIWQDDDLSTAVYQQYNEIYDFWGHFIGRIEDGELYELSFKDKNTIVAKCWIVDELGREKEFSQEFEYEPCDRAVLTYFEYMLGGGREWRRLKKEAGDATALVIVNPPSFILDKMPPFTTYKEGGLDKVAVVPLEDEAKITVHSLDTEDAGSDITETVKKGRAEVIVMTVSEGIPTTLISVKSAGGKEANWEAMQLSGRIPMMSTFIK